MEKSVTKDAESLAVRDVQKIIGDYFNDQDPRVRTAAIKAMVNIIMETKWRQFCLFVFQSSWLMLSWIHFESSQNAPYAHFHEGVGGITELKGTRSSITGVLFFELL